MNPYRDMRDKVVAHVLIVAAEFKRIFGKDLADFYEAGPYWPVLDYDRLFKALQVPLDDTSQDVIRKKYGAAAVEMIGRLIK